MRTREFGKLGWAVSEIGFGSWALGGGAWGQQSDDDSIAALHRALDLGVNLIDTAPGYGNGRSEQVIARALEGRHAKVHLVTKTPPKIGPWPPAPHDAVEQRYPEDYLRTNLEERLRFLKTDCIDVLLLHVWSRAWNRDPRPLETLAKFKAEGKIRAFGISTPDHDQDQLNTLLANGQIDVIQIVYNLFEQQPAAEALPLARASGVAVMGRLVFDEGSLTGKLTPTTRFPEGDFRNRYFRDTRLGETVARVEKIRADLEGTGYTMPQAAIQFALADPAMSCVIPGMRNPAQVESNIASAAMEPMDSQLLEKLYKHIWLRGNWHA
ncbi:MAG: aldo/keto reductase [Burkholderiales bacterium]|nr:aldo/keto reductase [Phycisphaerae bacterium]